MDILSAGHFYVILRVCPKNNFPEQQSEAPLSVDESVQGKVSAEAAQVFAMVGGEWGAPQRAWQSPLENAGAPLLSLVLWNRTADSRQ